MTGTLTAEYAGVVEKVRSWPPELRLNLMEDVLRSLRTQAQPPGRLGVPAELVRGIGAGNGAPPDDQTVRRWIEEHRLEKYG